MRDFTLRDFISSDDADPVKRVAAVAKFCRQDRIPQDESLAAILSAAIDLTHADKGNIQLLDSSGGLVIAAHSGFDEPFLKFFARVSDASSACGVALSTSEPVVVEDVAASELFAGTQGLGVMLEAGAAAVQSTPLISSAGRVIGIISTHFRRPHRPTDEELAAVSLLAGVAADHLEHGQTRLRARWSSEALETLLEILPVPASIATDPDCREIKRNTATAALYGVADPETIARAPTGGLPVSFYLDGRPLRPDELPLQRAAATGEAQRDLILDFVLPDGKTGAVSASAAPLFDDDGAVIGSVSAFADITSLRRAQVVQETLARELLHRGNNQLAVVQMLARRSLAGGVGVEEGLANLELRLRALGRANDLLVTTDFQGVPIHQLVGEVTGAFASQTRILGEEDVFLGPMQVQNLTMALHELTTNALKYGALSREGGVVSIDWAVDREEASRLRLAWRESGGPRVAEPPTRRGFGTHLIRSLYKDVTLDFAPDGLHCEIVVPLS